MRVESAAIGSPGARRTSTLQQGATVFLVKHSGGCALLRLALACIIAALPALAHAQEALPALPALTTTATAGPICRRSSSRPSRRSACRWGR